MTSSKGITYFDVGVDTDREAKAVGSMADWLRKTFSFNSTSRPVLDLDYFANVIDIGAGVGIALSTDGVGSKVLVAQRVGRFDTVGIDCVAMNVNDVLCVGADPVAMVDYVAIQHEPDPQVFGALAKGLHDGAAIAGISIPGGETAQLPEIIRGEPGGYGMDLVGTCIGRVSLDRLLVGRDLAEGDIIIGLQSSGIHSNGLTLARRVLFDVAGLSIDSYIPELGRTLGEELLEPTRIYAKEVVALVHSNVTVKALVNVTSDGFLNLTRVYRKDVGFIIEDLPKPHAVFEVIQRAGQVPIEEMFRVYNMGIGFCAIVAAKDEDEALRVLRAQGADARTIGKVTNDPDCKVSVPRFGIIGAGRRFVKESQL